MKYHLHMFGCQMNEADIQRVGSELEKIGLAAAANPRDADVVVLNTCVVRQSAEDKAHSYIQTLKPIKQAHPDKVITVMGCMVGVKGSAALQRAYPWVDVFMAPSETQPLVNYLRQREAYQLLAQETHDRFALQDGDLRLPVHLQGKTVSAHVPIVYGCSHACTFCVIPFRRGVERSRPVGEIVGEIRSLAEQGVREVTLLGQIVDRYGKDVADGPDLADLLRAVHTVAGIDRIRFLTSHPNWMSEKLLDAVAELPKVCEHIEVPVQAGDDDVLRAMRRGYTADDYRRLIETVRRKLPQVSIATDIIVGFCGETEAQFQKTYDLLAELKLDVAHLARYSPRPQTVARRTLADDVPEAEKRRRFQELEQLQEQVVAEINRRYLGETVEVLVETKRKDKWQGRTRTNKIVFFEDAAERLGQRVNVNVTWTGPWSLQGVPVV